MAKVMWSLKKIWDPTAKINFNNLGTYHIITDGKQPYTDIYLYICFVVNFLYVTM